MERGGRLVATPGCPATRRAKGSVRSVRFSATTAVFPTGSGANFAGGFAAGTATGFAAGTAADFAPGTATGFAAGTAAGFAPGTAADFAAGTSAGFVAGTATDFVSGAVAEATLVDAVGTGTVAGFTDAAGVCAGAARFGCRT